MLSLSLGVAAAAEEEAETETEEGRRRKRRRGGRFDEIDDGDDAAEIGRWQALWGCISLLATAGAQSTVVRRCTARVVVVRSIISAGGREREGLFFEFFFQAER